MTTTQNLHPASKRTRIVSHIDLISEQWTYERSDLDLYNFFLHMYVVRLGRIFEQLAMRQCQSRFGLRLSDIRVLLALRRGGRPFAKRPTDLFKALLVTSGAMTKQVDRLQKMRFVERIPDPAFGGGSLIMLTRKGLALVDEVATVLAKESVIAPAIARLSDNEREIGIQFIRRVLNEMEVLMNEIGDGDSRNYQEDETSRVRLIDS